MLFAWVKRNTIDMMTLLQCEFLNSIWETIWSYQRQRTWRICWFCIETLQTMLVETSSALIPEHRRVQRRYEVHRQGIFWDRFQIELARKRSCFEGASSVFVFWVAQWQSVLVNSGHHLQFVLSNLSLWQTDVVLNIQWFRIYSKTQVDLLRKMYY